MDRYTVGEYCSGPGPGPGAFTIVRPDGSGTAFLFDGEGARERANLIVAELNRALQKGTSDERRERERATTPGVCDATGTPAPSPTSGT